MQRPCGADADKSEPETGSMLRLRFRANCESSNLHSRMICCSTRYTQSVSPGVRTGSILRDVLRGPSYYP